VVLTSCCCLCCCGLVFLFWEQEAYRQTVKKVAEAKQSRLWASSTLCPDKGGWGWSWLERWQVAQPWNNPLMMSHHYKWVEGTGPGRTCPGPYLRS